MVYLKIFVYSWRYLIVHELSTKIAEVSKKP